MVWAEYNSNTQELRLRAPEGRSGIAPKAHELISQIAYDGIVDLKRKRELEREGYNPHEIPIPLFRNRRRRFRELLGRRKNEAQFRGSLWAIVGISLLAILGIIFFQ